MTLLLASLAGCTNTKQPAYADIPVNDKELNTSDPEEVIRRTAALFDRAENHDLDFYSPVYYNQALKALSDAQASLKNGQDKVLTLRAAVASRKLLERAQQVREQVDRNLKNLIKHRNLLIELDAEQWQEADWRSVSEEINQLIRLIEDDKVQAALEQEAGVRSDMYALEINTLLASQLKPAKDMLALAEEHEAKSYAAKLHNEADILIDDTAIYIRANYRDRKGIAERAENARLVAETAYKTALDAQAIFALEPENAESYIRSIHLLIDAITLEMQEDKFAPLTISESLRALHALVEEQKQNEKPSLPPTTQGEPAPSAEIEVLQVLDSIQLNEQPIENELNVDEQSFDEIEFVE